jgi:aspartyl-tRNA(Asn)/glutamyl-tRNA(Gln) amidotransferase subunit B
MSDSGELEQIVQTIIDKNGKSAEDYKNGKENALKVLIGQVMAETKGKANPQVVGKLLKDKLI